MARVLWITLLWFCTSLYAEIYSIGIYEKLIDPNLPKKDYIIGTSVIFKEYAQQEGYNADIITYETLEKMVDDFKKGHLDAIVADPLTITHNFSKTDLKAGVMAFKRNKTDSHTLIVVGRTNDKRPLSALLNASVTTINDPIADLYLKTIRLEAKLSTDASSKNYARSAHQGLLQLFFGNTDLMICDRASYLLASELNPQLKTQLRVHETLPITTGALLYFRKNFPEQAYERIVKSALRLNQSERGRQLLRIFRASVIDMATLQDLDSVAALDKRFVKLTEGKGK